MNNFVIFFFKNPIKILSSKLQKLNLDPQNVSQLIPKNLDRQNVLQLNQKILDICKNNGKIVNGILKLFREIGYVEEWDNQDQWIPRVIAIIRFQNGTIEEELKKNEPVYFFILPKF